MYTGTTHILTCTLITGCHTKANDKEEKEAPMKDREKGRPNFAVSSLKIQLEQLNLKNDQPNNKTLIWYGFARPKIGKDSKERPYLPFVYIRNIRTKFSLEFNTSF